MRNCGWTGRGQREQVFPYLGELRWQFLSRNWFYSRELSTQQVSGNIVLNVFEQEDLCVVVYKAPTDLDTHFKRCYYKADNIYTLLKNALIKLETLP